MTYIAAVGLQPALLAVLSLGAGLLVERAAGRRIPGALVVPLGFALLMCITQLTTRLDATAELTPWVVVLFGAGGFAAGWGRLRAISRETVWPALAGAGAYVAFAAVVMLAGRPTWAAYGADTTAAIHWLGADHFLAQGADFATGAPSAATTITAQYFDTAYPSGGNTLAGAVSDLLAQPVPWLWQPFLAVAGAMLALSLYALVRPAVSRGWMAAAVAVVGAQPALLFGFALQGQVKEVLGATFVPLLAGTVWRYAADVRAGAGARAALPIAVAGAGGIAAVGPGFALWLGPAALAALWLAWRAAGPGRRAAVLAPAAAFLAAVAVLALPSLLQLGTYVTSASGVLNDQVVPLGSLIRPLDALQAAGVWIAREYRVEPTGAGVPATDILIAVTLVCAAISAAWLWRRRCWPLLGYAALSVPAAVILVARGTPWIDAKAYAVAAPVIPTLALLVPAALAGTRVRWLGAAAALAVGIGVLASNALSYHDTSLAATDRYRELERIGQRFAGQGPLLRPAFDDYALYFLKGARPDAPGDNAPLFPPRTVGTAVAGYGVSVPLDSLATPYVERYPLIVVSRSPDESRPPSNYRLAFRGRYYDVWKRGPGRVIAHVPAGTASVPGGRLPCPTVRSLGRLAAAAGGRLVAAEPPPAIRVPVTALRRSGPVVPAGDPDLLVSSGTSRLQGEVRLPAGRYAVWLDASAERPVTVRVNGRAAGTLSGEIDYPRRARRVGTVTVAGGTARIEIDRPSGSLAPGDGAGAGFGPWLTFVPAAQPDARLVTVAPAHARRLCGRTLDWVEAVR